MGGSAAPKPESRQRVLLCREHAGERSPSGTWVRLGGEVVIDYALRLKREFAREPIVWVSGYTNDVMAYIPSLRVWKEGGYEGGGAMIYGSHPNRWSEQTHQHCAGAAVCSGEAVRTQFVVGLPWCSCS